jgi:hypothetical protein
MALAWVKAQNRGNCRNTTLVKQELECNQQLADNWSRKAKTENSEV